MSKKRRSTGGHPRIEVKPATKLSKPRLEAASYRHRSPPTPWGRGSRHKSGRSLLKPYKLNVVVWVNASVQHLPPINSRWTQSIVWWSIWHLFIRRSFYFLFQMIHFLCNCAVPFQWRWVLACTKCFWWFLESPWRHLQHTYNPTSSVQRSHHNLIS